MILLRQSRRLPSSARAPSLEYMEVILGHVKAEPYSLSFDGLDAASLLRAFKQLSTHDRLAVDPRFVVSLADVLLFEPPILILPAAGAGAALGRARRYGHLPPHDARR